MIIGFSLVASKGLNKQAWFHCLRLIFSEVIVAVVIVVSKSGMLSLSSSDSSQSLLLFSPSGKK